MQNRHIYRFDNFRLDVDNRQLLRDSKPVSLSARAFDLLQTLLENKGQLVEKDELFSSVWRDQIVEESNLTVHISQIRKALGETKNNVRYIETVPGYGYRFVGKVNDGIDDELVFETETISRITIEKEEVGFDLAQLPSPILRMFNWKLIGFAGLMVFTIAGAAWYWNSPPKLPNNNPVKLTKLTTSGKVINATMSPDGKFAVFSQKEEGGEGLWLRQLDSGSQTQIVPTKPIEYVGLTVSPDNQSIYASVFAKNEIDPLLFKIPIIGGVQQQIPNVVTGMSITISPDGKRFAFTTSISGFKETYLGVSDIDGSNSRPIIRAKDDIRNFKHFVASPLAWSPDGAEIAAAVFDKTETGWQAAIIMVNPDDESERYLSKKRWDNVDNLAWLDSERLAFIASEEGQANQVWILSRKTGEAKQITNELQSYNWLAAANGKLLAVKSNLFSNLRIADFNETAKTLTNREFYNASENLDLIDWSPNGEILFASRASGKPEIWKINNDGSKRNQLTVDANVTYGFAVSPLDGSIIYGSKLKGKNGIWQMDSAGENLRQLSEGNDHSPDVSNDGMIVFQRGFNQSEGVFIISPNESAPRKLKEKCILPAISSDGKFIACYSMDWDANQKWNIALISNETGELIRRITLPVPVYGRRIRFHPSGKYITQILSNGEDLSLLLIPLDGGETRIIDGLGKGSSNLPQWSADGKQFIYPLITATRDAVLLTDFLSYS